MNIFDKIIKNGTTVLIKGTPLKATVIGVCIRGVENFTIEYHCQWMNSGTINEHWLYSYMVEVFIDTRTTPGMVNYDNLPVKK